MQRLPINSCYSAVTYRTPRGYMLECSTQALIVGNIISVMDLRLRSLLLLL